MDSAGGESLLSFVAQATTTAGVNTNSVVVDGIQLPVGGVSFNVYRGTNPQSFFRIASARLPRLPSSIRDCLRCWCFPRILSSIT